jgi:hypothetical protein
MHDVDSLFFMAGAAGLFILLVIALPNMPLQPNTAAGTRA